MKKHEFSPAPTDRAAPSAHPPRRGPLLAVVASVLVIALILSVLLLPTERAGGTSLSAYALAEAEYPQLPQRPLKEDYQDRREYNAAMSEYYKALDAIRGEINPRLSDEFRTLLCDFAGRSTLPALSPQAGINAVYSPLSLWTALAMLAQCANGQSREEILDALRLDDVEQAAQSIRELWRVLYTDDSSDSLLFATSVWLNAARNKEDYVPETLDTLARDCYTDIYAVPMGTAPADNAVTQWVNRQTRGLIGSDGPVIKTAPEFTSLLASSLYYRSDWLYSFDPAANTQEVFTCSDGSQTTADFMHKTLDDYFQKGTGYQAASLPLGLGSIRFILPDEGLTPEQLLRNPQSHAELLLGADANSSYGEVRWSIPKFDAASQLDLMDTLGTLGIKAVTSKIDADLSMLTTIPSYLSNIEQLARIRVDEEGVEAAAVTLSVSTAVTAPPAKQGVCIMNLDRPFLFVISGTRGVPLFIGIINQVF